ncbi:MAG: prepilin-type N-terminal cleavage/methylation domain-containing protein [Candidatus Eisenbacteria bacterium]
MSASRRNGPAGFSLVEMVLAITLLGFAFLAMGKLMVTSSEHSKQGRHDTIALNSAGEILERMRAVDFDQMKKLFDGIDTDEIASVPAEARNWAGHLRENLGPSARCLIDVYDENERADLSRGLVEVDIRMSWVERGFERSIRTSTYVVRMGS